MNLALLRHLPKRQPEAYPSNEASAKCQPQYPSTPLNTPARNINGVSHR
jgi:hypothetical protein